MPARPCSTSPRRSSRQAVAAYATTPRRCVSTGTGALPGTARPRREQTAKSDPIKERRPEAGAYRAFCKQCRGPLSAPPLLGRGCRAERRELGEQVGRLDLVEILRFPQALKPPSTEASEADPVRERREHRRAHGGRHDDLTAVCRGADTRGGMHRETDVAGVGEGWP